MSSRFAVAAVDPPPPSETKTERFDHDPGWEGFNNHIARSALRTVRQDFGYSPTNFAGRATGEIGGVIQRAAKPAFYAAVLSPAKTLEDKLTATGSFAVTASAPNAGVFFGFFNSQQPGGSGRAIASLGLDFDFERHGGRLAVRSITSGNKSCGTFITPYLPGKYRPTPIKSDGTRYQWTLDYDPKAAGGNGNVTFTLHNHAPVEPMAASLPEASQEEARKHFPYTTTFTFDLPAGFKKEGATFDRFGLANGTKSGGPVTIFFDDLECNGQAEDLSKEPGWIG